ncbi:MAG: hypothetical protein IJ737_08085 [Ruminococcus sp.]|nr:hypothetical protein [Ruminococcus sp.]
MYTVITKEMLVKAAELLEEFGPTDINIRSLFDGRVSLTVYHDYESSDVESDHVRFTWDPETRSYRMAGVKKEVKE